MAIISLAVYHIAASLACVTHIFLTTLMKTWLPFFISYIEVIKLGRIMNEQKFATGWNNTPDFRR